MVLSVVVNHLILSLKSFHNPWQGAVAVVLITVAVVEEARIPIWIARLLHFVDGDRFDALAIFNLVELVDHHLFELFGSSLFHSFNSYFSESM